MLHFFEGRRTAIQGGNDLIKNLSGNRILWLLIAVLSLVCAMVGVVCPGIYSKVISDRMMPGTISQDLQTILASIVLLVLTARMKEGQYKKQIVVIGILSYLFYAYGVYSIERIYSPLYFCYLAVFGLSFYALVYGLVGLRREVVENIALPGLLRKIAVGFAFFVPLLFVPLWSSQIIPLIQQGNKLEFTYSIYVLDLGLVMPAFAIIGWMAAKKRGLGLLLLPVLLIKGFTVLLPVGLGEFLKPAYSLPMDGAGIVFYLGLSVPFLILAVLCLARLSVNNRGNQ